MRLKNFILVFLFFLVQYGYAQTNTSKESFIAHVVESKESVYTIAQKYKMDPSEIYRHNRFAIDELPEGIVLNIPKEKINTKFDEVILNNVGQENNNLETSSSQQLMDNQVVLNEVASATLQSVDKATTHEVQKGETWYSISRRYGLTVDVLQKYNVNLLSKPLQIGATINLVDSGTVFERNSEHHIHEVLSGETLYGLSKKYGVSIDEIISQNQILKMKGLQSGQKITIPAKK